MRYRVLDRFAQFPLVGGPAIRQRACGRPRAVGLVAILVTDIVGSTQLARELGDDRYFDLVARHQAVVRLEAERGGALSIKPQGDGNFLVFASADSSSATGPRPTSSRAATNTSSSGSNRSAKRQRGGAFIPEPGRPAGADVRLMPPTSPLGNSRRREAGARVSPHW
jgi:class 3 adenylate cyclase